MGPCGMQEHLNHPRDLRYSYSFEGDPSSAYGGFGHSLKGTRIGLYPELSDVFLLSLAQPISNVHRCRHGGGYVGGSTAKDQCHTDRLMNWYGSSM